LSEKKLKFTQNINVILIFEADGVQAYLAAFTDGWAASTFSDELVVLEVEEVNIKAFLVVLQVHVDAALRVGVRQ
jgi:hypothetical protein